MSDEQKALEPVHPDQPGFVDKVTPAAAEELLLLKCPKCQGVHFRHAGYVHLMLPYLRGGGQKEMELSDIQVKICVACKAAFGWVANQLYDLTAKIDLGAWEKTEKQAHRATGPGGQC